MSAEEKLGTTMVMELIEDELEERKISYDRRQKECKDSMKEVTESERRKNTDRRTVND